MHRVKLKLREERKEGERALEKNEEVKMGNNR